MTTLVEVYEEKHHPVSLPDPIEAILYHLESRGPAATWSRSSEAVRGFPKY